MSQLKSFDAATVREMGNELDALLGAFAKKHGIAVRPVSLRYNRVICTIKTEFTVSEDNQGLAYSREAADFKRYAKQFDLDQDMLGKTFTNKNETLEIIGLKPMSPAYPVLVRKLSNGKLYKYPVSFIRLAFDRSTTRPTEFHAGTRVMAVYEDGDWYPATYIKKMGNGLHRVRWEDGTGLDTVDQVKTR